MKIKWDKFYYKALPDCLTIKESTIVGAGLGLFATKDIERDYDFGTSHIKVPPIVGYIRTPIGGFVNHSKKSNTIIIQLYDWDDYKIFNLIATGKINKGQELLTNYETGVSKAMSKLYINGDKEKESREYDVDPELARPARYGIKRDGTPYLLQGPAKESREYDVQRVKTNEKRDNIYV